MTDATSEKILFKCICCSATFALDYVAPDGWATVSRYAVKDRFKYICSNCGAFIYPVDLCDENLPDWKIFFSFAGCINAYKCYLYDQYSPQCETPVFSPKCLYAIHKDLEDISDRLSKLEKLPAGKKPRKQSHEEGRVFDTNRS